MNTSRAGSRIHRAAALRVLAVLAALFVAAGAEGCARSSAKPAGRLPPEAPAAAVAARPARRAAAPPSAPTPGPARRPPVLDPGEEITPEELETIPEPVAASPGGAGGATPRSAAKTAQEVSETGSGAAGQGLAAGAGTGMAFWTVQVLATLDRDLADRTANEASRLLGVKARVQREGPTYKVRLGGYGSEEEARFLRDQAVRSGYPGAFRIRCAPTTLNKG